MQSEEGELIRQLAALRSAPEARALLQDRAHEIDEGFFAQLTQISLGLEADGDALRALSPATMAVLAAQTIEDPLQQAIALLHLGKLYARHEELSDARTTAKKELQNGLYLLTPEVVGPRGAKARWVCFALLESLGSLYFAEDGWDSLIELWRGAEAVLGRHKYYVLYSNFFLAAAHFGKGDPVAAFHHAMAAAAIFSEGLPVEDDVLPPHRERICGLLYPIGRGLRKADLSNLAAKVFEKVLAIDPSFADSDFQLGFSLMFSDSFEESAQVWRKIPNDHPKKLDALANEAQCLESLGRSAEALSKIEQVVRGRPGDAQMRLIRGNLLFDLERYEEALPDYEGFLQQSSQAGGQHILHATKSKARCLYHLGRIEEGLSEIDALAERSDDAMRAATWIARGDVLSEAGRFEEAGATYERALRDGCPRELILPRLLDVRTNTDDLAAFVKEVRAFARREERPRDALQLIERYLQKRPHDPELRRLHAFALLEATQPQQAEKELTEILEATPQDAEAHHLRGLARLMLPHGEGLPPWDLLGSSDGIPAVIADLLRAGHITAPSGFFRVPGAAEKQDSAWQASVTPEQLVLAYWDLLEATQIEPSHAEYRRVFLWLFDRLLLDPSYSWLGPHFVANHLQVLPEIEPILAEVLAVAPSLSERKQWDQAVSCLQKAQGRLVSLGLEVSAARLSFRIADNRIRLDQLQLALDDLDEQRFFSLLFQPITRSLAERVSQESKRHAESYQRPVASVELEYRGVYALLLSPVEEFRIEVNKAEVYSRMGRHEAAYENISKASKQLARLQIGADDADVRSGMQVAAKIWRQLGRYDEAQKLLDAIKPHAASEGERYSLVSLQASLDLLCGDARAALEKYAQLASLDLGPVDRYVSTLQRAGAHNALSEFEAALELLNGLDVGSSVAAHLRFGRFYARAVALEGCGRADEAFESIWSALPLLDEKRSALESLESRSAWFAQQESFFAVGVRMAVLAGRKKEALYLAERSKGRSLLDELAIGRAEVGEEIQGLVLALRNRKEVQELLLRLEVSLEQDEVEAANVDLVHRLGELDPHLMLVEGAFRPISLDRVRNRLVEIQQDAQKIETAIERIQLGLANPTDARVMAYEELRALLADEERHLSAGRRIVLAEYYVLPGASLLFVGRSDLEEPAVIDLQVRLPEAVRDKYVAAIDLQDRSVKESFDQTIRPLVGPLTDWARPDDIILCVRHAVLHYLPLHLADVGGQILAERNPVVYSPSASMIARCIASRRPPVGRSLVYGDTLDDLPSAREEAIAVARKLGTTARVGAAASKRSLLEQLKGDLDVIHIACHGYFDVEAPLESGILLAPTQAGQPERLTARELPALDLKSSLMVLSACQSGATLRTGGDELVGLARAALRTGTASVVLSLSSVDDLATALLMLRFYELSRFATNGEGLMKCDAMREAQRFLRDITVRKLIEYCDDALGSNEPVEAERRLYLRTVRTRALALSGSTEDAKHEVALLEKEVAEGATIRERLSGVRLTRALPGPSESSSPGGNLDCRPFANAYYWGGFMLLGDWF
jgi:CHAT domain-containing protein/regulator of sirC expression with transglutaminase-like and TPR domain